MKKEILLTAACAALAGAPAVAQEAVESKGLAVYSNDGQFKPYEFTRHAVGDNDIQIEILYAGICHSDVHHVHEDWGPEKYPMVPGHEIAGRVVKIGKNVTKFKVGDYAGIGCMIGSCGECEACLSGHEQYCEKGAIMTYHDVDRYNNNEDTQGGYSNNYVVSQDFAINIPEGADLEKVAPLLCAGITTYTPIQNVGVKKGDKVAVAGFGGLGHMAVKYMKALGAEVTVFDITDDKRADALQMGAVRYVNVNNPSELEGLTNTLDFVLSTIPARYDPVMYVKMLKRGGEMAIVGLPGSANTPQISISSLVMQADRKVFGSQIGGIQETQDMLNYSVANNIYPDIEIISADGQAVTDAFQNVLDGKVKFRYVIDMRTMK